MSRVVEEELTLLLTKLHQRLPDLAFVAIVAGVDDCDDKPAMLHIETQLATKPDLPYEQRAVIMDAAAAQVRSGKKQDVPS